MRLFIAAFLLAISYAQTACTDLDSELVALAAKNGAKATSCSDAIGYCSRTEVANLCPSTCSEYSGCGQQISGIMQDILDKHNVYRCMHNVPLLSWNEEIAANAQQYAEETGGQMSHSSHDSRSDIAGFWMVGENLFWGSKAWESFGVLPVSAWYDEINITPGGSGLVTEFLSGTGHYTQVVWKSTTDLGCGGYEGLLVCQYGVTGNVQGQFATEVTGPVLSESVCLSDPSATPDSETEIKESLFAENIANDNMNAPGIAVLALALIGGISIVANVFWKCACNGEYKPVLEAKNSYEI